MNAKLGDTGVLTQSANTTTLNNTAAATTVNVTGGTPLGAPTVIDGATVAIWRATPDVATSTTVKSRR